MSCQHCESDRVMEFNAKSSDCNFISIEGKEHSGYVPRDLGIGGGDYVRFSMCLDCGRVQGDFPLPLTDLENDS